MAFTSDKKLTEVMNFLLLNGDANTMQTFGLNSESLSRYKRQAKKKGIIDDKFESLVKLSEKLSAKEINGIANGDRLAKTKDAIHNFEGETFKFLAASDLHIGSAYTNLQNIYDMLDVAKSEKCDFITLSGDITEGMSGRPGHVYELTDIGYEAQKERAIEVLGSTGIKTYMIDGNHDRWYIKSAGALIVKEICNAIPNAEFLGHDEGDIYVGGVKIRLWHGEDASSYATSYRIQKLVEAFTGGDKPNILLAGHVHKTIYCFERHIHCFSTGCVQQQSKWMCGKRIAAHTGFWVIEVTLNQDGEGKTGVGKITSAWYPFYV